MIMNFCQPLVASSQKWTIKSEQRWIFIHQEIRNFIIYTLDFFILMHSARLTMTILILGSETETTETQTQGKIVGELAKSEYFQISGTRRNPSSRHEQNPREDEGANPC